MKEKILISSCLCGNCCKYNGGHNKIDNLEELKKCYDLLPICPEVLGKLPIPRYPSEIKNDNMVYNSIGENVTDAFQNGAKTSLLLAKKNGVTKALLKESSPSCGVHFIYDGSFQGKKIEGCGITTLLLKQNGFSVYSSEEIQQILEDKE